MTTALGVGLVFFMAAWVQGASGFGSALVALPLLTFLIDVKAAVPLCILCGFSINVLMTIRLRSGRQWRDVLPLILGALPGIVVGVALLKHLPARTILFWVGLLLTLYGFYTLLRQPVWRLKSSLWGLMAGFLTGAIGAAFSVGGPPAVIYCSLRGCGKDQLRALLSIFFLVMSLLTAGAHLASGVTTSRILILFAGALPLTILGVLAGMSWTSRISEVAFRRVLSILLCLLGLMLMFKSL